VPLNDSLAAQVQNAVTNPIAFQKMTTRNFGFGFGEFNFSEFDINATAFPELVKRFLALPIPGIADKNCTWSELLKEAQAANLEISLNDLPFVQFLNSTVSDSNGWKWGDAIMASLRAADEGEGYSIDLNELLSKYFFFDPLDILEVLLSCGVPLADLAIFTWNISEADLAVA
jgi:hypothetical protein